MNQFPTKDNKLDQIDKLRQARGIADEMRWIFLSIQTLILREKKWANTTTVPNSSGSLIQKIWL